MEWKGDKQEAIRLYREAASDNSADDVAGWCLYEAARILVEDGNFESASKQIEHILNNYDNLTLKAECEVLLTGKNSEKSDILLQKFLLEYPDSIYSDLSRLKIEGRLDEPF